MGLNMTKRLLLDKHEVYVFDLDKKSLESATKIGAKPTNSISKLIKALEKPATIWVMVPSGETTENVIEELIRELKAGDFIIDGGNSY